MSTNEERRKQHRHAHKQRVLRGISDELVAEFDAATKAAGGDRSSITRQLWEYYLDKPGATFPERPTGTKRTSAVAYDRASANHRRQELEAAGATDIDEVPVRPGELPKPKA